MSEQHGAALAARRSRAIPRGVATATPYFIQRASNAELWDVRGRRLVDFASGIAVLNTGHCHADVVRAIERQLRSYSHLAFQVTAYEPYIALAERLNAVAPVRGPAKCILFSTGAEAVENAVKIARAATRRRAIIAFAGAFHGRTLMALALTGKAAPYKQDFGPLGAEVYRAPFPIEHEGISTADSLRALQSLFATDVAPEQVAAIIIEPVQGEGGFHPAPPEFLAGLRALCDKYGILLIADEIQTGFARTGRLFALEHASIQADLLVAAKSLAGGLPLSAVIGSAHIMDAPEPGGLGGTYAGSPLACVAALEVLDIIEREKLCSRAEELGSLARAELSAMGEDAQLMPIGHVRGYGAMLGFDILRARGESEVAPGAGREVAARAHERGLLVLSCGARSEAIRLLFPLTASSAIVKEGLGLLRDALRVGQV